MKKSFEVIDEKAKESNFYNILFPRDRILNKSYRGEKELAIKNYEKSVELNPNNRNGINALKKLKEN